ncbi:hypothetical protein V6Z96_002482 [Aspergillus fumigatus]
MAASNARPGKSNVMKPSQLVETAPNTPWTAHIPCQVEEVPHNLIGAKEHPRRRPNRATANVQTWQCTTWSSYIIFLRPLPTPSLEIQRCKPSGELTHRSSDSVPTTRCEQC